MSYYSDVKIVLSQEGYRVFEETLNSLYKQHMESCEASEKIENPLDTATVTISKNRNFCVIGWLSVNWYSYSKKVGLIQQALEEVYRQNHSYRFGIIGEEFDDYTFERHDGMEDIPELTLERSLSLVF